MDLDSQLLHDDVRLLVMDLDSQLLHDDVRLLVMDLDSQLLHDDVRLLVMDLDSQLLHDDPTTKNLTWRIFIPRCNISISHGVITICFVTHPTLARELLSPVTSHQVPRNMAHTL
ncbi:hypothetical protein RRG08_067360 [Elysia crispata]|uniref:Uncharacterized protein n=1 Tax=Elysia crispata TaxID=231223 RepID=A0AAE0ZBU4_9GAST|nr:hypothetical protein RRG08_067360 [Elysia crispata]